MVKKKATKKTLISKQTRKNKPAKKKKKVLKKKTTKKSTRSSAVKKTVKTAKKSVAKKKKSISKKKTTGTRVKKKSSSPRKKNTLKKQTIYNKSSSMGTKDRKLRVIKELSEFLKIINIQQSTILQTMLVRFCVEAVIARRGTLFLTSADQGVLYNGSTYLYKDGKIDTSFTDEHLASIRVPRDQGIVGNAVRDSAPILSTDAVHDKRYADYIDTACGIRAGSVLCMPLIVDSECMGALEVVREVGEPPFTEEDLETIIIISNFAAATMENAKLFMWAITDNVTKLYNRHYFNNVFNQELARSLRYGNEFSIVMIDVDMFKQINDNYGHAIGDRMLRKITATLIKNLRKNIDVPARYGGDEFIILLPETGSEGAKVYADRLLEEVRLIKLEYNGQTIHATVSIGISTFPKDSRERQSLLEKADDALYTAKENGRNQVVVFTDEIQRNNHTDI